MLEIENEGGEGCLKIVEARLLRNKLIISGPWAMRDEKEGNDMYMDMKHICQRMGFIKFHIVGIHRLRAGVGVSTARAVIVFIASCFSFAGPIMRTRRPS
jgi:hypothetical protein